MPHLNPPLPTPPHPPCSRYLLRGRNAQDYYTGDYHSRRPCKPDGLCNTAGGGCGGAPFPEETPDVDGSVAEVEDGSVGKGGACVKKGVSTEKGGGLDERGLWWSCGAWSIMGR